MSLQDSTLSREGSPEEEIMAAVVFSLGPLEISVIYGVVEWTIFQLENFV
eukprot:bmy_10722T0